MRLETKSTASSVAHIICSQGPTDVIIQNPQKLISVKNCVSEQINRLTL